MGENGKQMSKVDVSNLHLDYQDFSDLVLGLEWVKFSYPPISDLRLNVLVFQVTSVKLFILSEVFRLTYFPIDLLGKVRPCFQFKYLP